ncbi:MAG: hypothetical protein R3B45_02175 [Bdellovibrionota bacterium]
MNSFVERLQKDLAMLQSTLQKEGNDLVKKVKKIAAKNKLDSKAKEIEKLIERKLKTFEPAIETLYKEIKKNAKKAGVDLSKLEINFKKKTAAAKKKLKTKKKTTKKKSTTKKKTAKKTTTKKTTKKASKKKTTTAK